MKLNCNIEIYNRALSLANIALRKKSQRCVLTIGRQSVKNDDLYILLQTQQNKQGTKYKINGNIDKVFMKFINDGKATIRLIEPSHDLIIQSDTIQLKSFLHVLKLGISKKIDPSVLPISNLNPKSISSLPKTKVVIKKNSEYPTLQGFPKTTQELHLTGLNRKSFDRQILRLQSLRILNLSENQISFLPKELGCLPNLQELILSQNHLGKSAYSKWTWLDQDAIKNKLCLLDIRKNLLTELPEQIGKLNALVNLKVSQNILTYLPQSIGTLPCLKDLDLSKNSLSYLPGSLKNLRLHSLDISDNPLSNCDNYSMFEIGVPTLVECSAKSFLKSRKVYNASLIPLTLVKYLDEAKYCICGNACFDCYIRKFKQFDLNTISIYIKMTKNQTCVFDCYFCSVNCTQRCY